MRNTVKFMSALCLLGMVAGNVWADLDDGLVAFYPFSGNVNDESGNGYHGTVQGALITADRFGKLGAYGFDGVDGRIKLDGEAMNSLNSFTITCWMKTFDTGSSNNFFSAAHSGQPNELVIQHNNGKMTLFVHSQSHQMSETRIDDNSWHQVVISREGSVIEFYLDGHFDSVWDSAPVGNLTVEKSGLWLGGDQDCVGGCWESNQQFDGLLDDLRIYSRALSESEIQALYDTEKQAPDDGDDSYQAGYEAGQQACQDNPADCGIKDDAGYEAGKQDGMQVCQDNPADCDIPVGGTCEPATLSYDFKLHIPRLHYTPVKDVDTHMVLWADFEPNNLGQLLFQVTGYGEAEE
jgi:hypothetical protein